MLYVCRRVRVDVGLRRLNRFVFQLQPVGDKAVFDLLCVCGASRFDQETDETAADRHVRIAVTVVYFEDIAAEIADDGTGLVEHARLIRQRDCDGRLTAAHDQSSCDDAVKDVDVNVAATDDADDFFAL